MRISEDRYTQDRLRIDVAYRLMYHGARAHTIREWTGLTEDRIRNLSESYRSKAPGHPPALRGKSPGKASFFFSTPGVQREASVLASIFDMFGVTSTRLTADAKGSLPSIERAARLCQAFEYHLMMFPTPQITFEHAILLVNELARGIELRLEPCSACYSLIVVDPLTLRDDVLCGSCCGPQKDERRGGC
jgi:hypothetical protein